MGVFGGIFGGDFGRFFSWKMQRITGNFNIRNRGKVGIKKKVEKSGFFRKNEKNGKFQTKFCDFLKKCEKWVFFLKKKKTGVPFCTHQGCIFSGN